MNIDEDILKIKNKKLKIKKLNDLNKLYEILEYTKFLDEFNPDINERLYCFINSINKVKTCLICNKKLKFYGFSKGYRNYCSKKCAASDKNRLEKIEKTCLNKYGVSHFTKTKQYQEN